MPGSLSWSNWNLEMVVCGGRKINRKTRRKTLGAGPKTATNSTHVWHLIGIEPGSFGWEASSHTSSPSLLLFLKCLLSHKQSSDDNFVTSYYICSLYIPEKRFYLPSQMELDPFEPAGTPWASLQDQTLTKITAWRHQGSLEPRVTWFLRQSKTENGRKDFKNLSIFHRSFQNTEFESETKAKRAREETRLYSSQTYTHAITIQPSASKLLQCENFHVTWNKPLSVAVKLHQWFQFLRHSSCLLI